MPCPSGLLCLNKPAGLTSRDVVNRIQRVLRPAKVGHAGTLDPLATGVLLVAVGPATKLISHLQNTEKIYQSTFLLGQSSDTDDVTGSVQHHEVPSMLPTHEQMHSALLQFTGEIRQHPPAYSAVHIKGRRAYDLARSGKAVIPDAKTVVIHEIEVLRWEWPELQLRIRCGSGTYIRSIARDLGNTLGCGALMSRLERTAVGPFSIEQSLSCEEPDRDSLVQQLIPVVRLIRGLSRYWCRQEDLEHLRCGRRFIAGTDRLEIGESAGAIAVLSPDQQHLLALAELRDDGLLQPRTVFQQAIDVVCNQPADSQ